MKWWQAHTPLVSLFKKCQNFDRPQVTYDIEGQLKNLNTDMNPNVDWQKLN